MNNPMAPTIEIQGKYGRIGSITPYDAWEGRKSMEHAKDKVSKVMAICYGREKTKNPEVSWHQALNDRHLSVFEHIPVWRGKDGGMRANSLRHEFDAPMGEAHEFNGGSFHPATSFLVEAPIFVMRQWVRHGIYAITEMSRRYTTHKTVPYAFYGLPKWHRHWDNCMKEFELRIAEGIPLEDARTCLPLELMTKWWWTGYDLDMLHQSEGPLDSDGFCELRESAHAQSAIRCFSTEIKTFLTKKNGGNSWLP